MKKIIVALILTAAVATPAMAQTYMQSNTWSSGRAMQAQPHMGMGYDAYAYAPGPRDTSEINSSVFAMDPDPAIRHQLYIQSTVSDR